MPADNGRFGASGGVGSSESEQVTSLFALVQTAVNPPPVAKPLGRCVQAEMYIKKRSNAENPTKSKQINNIKDETYFFIYCNIVTCSNYFWAD